MKKVIVAIGGGAIGGKKILPDGGVELYPVETLAIDQEIIRLSGKKNPKLLFLGTASNDSESYADNVRGHFGGTLGCDVSVLKLVDEAPSYEQVSDAILGTDIIYVGGGNTARMIEIWKEKGVDKLLRRAWEHGVVLSGLSAGANCWFARCSTDSAAIAAGNEKGTMLGMADCLGFLPGVFVPHLLNEPGRRPFAEKTMAAENDGETWYLSDDKSALVSVDDEIYGISADENSAVRVTTYDGAFRYKILSARQK
jgi:dipeptidase E